MARHDNLVSGLVRKRRELNRAIREHEAEIERLRHGAAIIGEVLLMWSGEDRKPPRGANDPGPLSRCILTALRLSGEPLGISEITRRVMLARGQEGRLSDRRPHVRKALNAMLVRGLVVADGNPMLWAIAR